MENPISGNLAVSPLEETINLAIRMTGEHLHACVRDEDVHLSGEISGREAKKNVGLLVRGFPGVRRVVNHIRLRPAEVRMPVEHF